VTKFLFSFFRRKMDMKINVFYSKQ